jgi:hypothetical protein
MNLKRVYSFIIIFVTGFILGEIDTRPIMNKISHEIAQTNIVSIIGLISSITTLLVFLMYIVGKVYAIKKAEMFLTESFFVRHNNDISDLNITKEVNLDKDIEAHETIYLVSNEPIRNISFYTYDWENDKEGALIESIGSLKTGEALCIYTLLPCGIPNYIIKYERFDYVIGKLVLSEDGRGLTNFRTPEIKNTMKSYFYHLVKS